MATLQGKWDEFQTLILPHNASPVQRIETRRAFYSGAQAMFVLVTELAAQDKSEDASVKVLESYNQELQAFAAKIALGEA